MNVFQYLLSTTSSGCPEEPHRRQALVVAAATLAGVSLSLSSCGNSESDLLQASRDCRGEDPSESLLFLRRMDKPPFDDVQECVSSLEQVTIGSKVVIDFGQMYIESGTKQQCYDFANKLKSSHIAAVYCRFNLYKHVGDRKSLEKLRKMYVENKFKIEKQGHSRLGIAILETIAEIENSSAQE